MVEKEDLDYAKNHPLQIERFLAKMSARSVDAPEEQGGKALAVHLEKQEKDRGVMPYYTTLEPANPVTIPGKASHLGLWVKAASDWGRVVYVLRDAKGAKRLILQVTASGTAQVQFLDAAGKVIKTIDATHN